VICRVDDIPVLGARRVARDKGCRRGGVPHRRRPVFALLDRCPHKGGPLSQGIVFGDGVACPLHNWTIGLADGCARRPTKAARRALPARWKTARCCWTPHELASTTPRPARAPRRSPSHGPLPA
jgi:nitrite reductase (NADH) small subunit